MATVCKPRLMPVFGSLDRPPPPLVYNPPLLDVLVRHSRTSLVLLVAIHSCACTELFPPRVIFICITR